MKQIQCRLRTSSAIHDWLSFVARIENVVTSPSFRVNGKQRNGDGFYTALSCEVEPNHLIDVLTEYIAFLEKKPTLSFELVVRESETGSDETDCTESPRSDVAR